MPVCVWIASASVLLSVLAACLAAARLSKAPKLRSLLSRLDGCETELLEMGALLKRIDARDRMRAVRSGKTAETDSSSQTKANDCPDAYADPVGWKKWKTINEPPHIGRHKE